MITLEGGVHKVHIFLHILVIDKREKNIKVGRIAILPTKRDILDRTGVGNFFNTLYNIQS